MSIRDFAVVLLAQHGLDGEIYVDHVLELLRNDHQSCQQFLLDCNVAENQVSEILQRLTAIQQRGTLSEEDQAFLRDNAVNFLANDLSQVDLSEPTEAEEEDPLTNDISEFTTAQIDWISLIESVESHLFTYFHYSQPEFSPVALMVALFKSYYDIDSAAQWLLHSVSVLNQCKPCRHLLSSGCYRRDCYFDHDLKRFPCRYWLHSVCANSPQIVTANTSSVDEISADHFLNDLTNAGSCLFAHDLPAFQPTRHSMSGANLPLFPPHTNTNPIIVSEEFPTLSSSSVKTTSLSKSQHHHYLSAISASTPSKATTSEDFPSLATAATNHQKKTRSTTKSGPPGHPVAVSSQQYSSSTSSFPPPPPPASSSQVSTKRQLFSDLLAKAHFITTTTSNNRSSNSKIVRPGEWVESGEIIRQDYEQLREEARQLAIARNKLLQEATLAFVSGSKAMAKSLSSQGQSLNLEMKELHLQAAKAVFRKRNPLPQLERGRIDLHGLHVSEALDCIAELLPLYEKAGMTRLTVVTGTGHHTKGPQQGQARLLPYVREYCEQQLGRGKVQEVRDTSGYSGGLTIFLS